MIKILLSLCFAGITGCVLIFFLKNPISSKENKTKITEVSILPIDSDSVILNHQNYPYKLILNFYGTECGLCLTEINDIVSFSRRYKVRVLFITADPLAAINKFRHELEKQNITDNQIMFARISLDNATKLFGDLIVPQTIVLNDSFQVSGIKKGILSRSFLRKSFE